MQHSCKYGYFHYLHDMNYDVIIIGGSYAGLSAAMALGRALRHVLILDSGKPCNRQTPHSHNFITQDGKQPGEIAAIAKEQVLQYKTVHFIDAKAISGSKLKEGFEVITEQGVSFIGKKLLFATGIIDQMPPVKGFADCWGISVLHCPYCHGYEVRDETLGVICNGEMALEFSRLIYNWSKKLTLLTNGPSTLNAEQVQEISDMGIKILETEIVEILHKDGKMSSIVMKDNSKQTFDAVFTRLPFQQHCKISEQLGCEILDNGYLKVDEFHRTTVPGIYAAGDNTTPFRAVSIAIAAGTKSGASINKELIEES